MTALREATCSESIGEIKGVFERNLAKISNKAKLSNTICFAGKYGVPRSGAVQTEMSFHRWLDRRENGFHANIGDGDFIMKRIYSSIEPIRSWNDLPSKHAHNSKHGAIFNLEFSPLGHVLAAACEKKAIILFDAVTQKQTEQILDAHQDNVNCIKFIDNHTFATCSDDTTVALWDLRFLKRRLRILQGHSNWVKNIEYSEKDGLLVTSGFDGSIFTWDLNSQTEEGLVCQKVFNTSGLMRCRISPDCTKLVMCTTGGYMMIIHRLDLTTLRKDLAGFRPCIYRLMQMGNQYLPQAAKYDHIFSKKQKRNRVELVTDFPEENEAEVVLALRIHPQGLSFLTRNISYGEQTEWTCIHDINEEPDDITMRRPDKRKRKLIDEDDSSSPTNSDGRSNLLNPENPNRPSTSSEMRLSTPLFLRPINRSAGSSSRHNADGNINSNNSRQAGASHNVTNGQNTSTSSNNTSNDPQRQSNRGEFIPDIWAAEITIQERAARQARGRQTNSVTGYDFVYAISSGILPLPSNDINSTSSVSTDDECDFNILQNPKKLLFYIQESNAGRGFIKEFSFSADGRIICSPYGAGVRLLSYSENCPEHPRPCMNEELKKNPKQLVEIKTINCHSDIVLSSAFSPIQPLLVTGCELGKVTWNYPNL